MKKTYTRTTLPAAALAVGLATALALAVPLSASAHVTLDENTAEPGSYALLTFKVPNESATANTTSVTVALPTDTPFVSVRTVPVAGWTAEIIRTTLPEPVQVGTTTITEAPTSIVWTATGPGLGDGELGLFPFSVGPVPDVDSIELPVDQGYSDGSVVAWAGDDVPTLYVNAEPAGDHHGASDAETSGTDAPGSDHAPGAESESLAALGVGLGAGGLVLGAVALVLALAGVTRRRSDAR